jgi:hypothetical protein
MRLLRKQNLIRGQYNYLIFIYWSMLFEESYRLKNIFTIPEIVLP